MVKGKKWSAGFCEAGDDDENRKGVYCGGIGSNSPLLLDKTGCPCQAYVELVAKLILVEYLNAYYTSMGANNILVCTDNISSLVNLMYIATGEKSSPSEDRSIRCLVCWRVSS